MTMMIETTSPKITAKVEPSNKRKKVSFYPKVLCFGTIHRNDYTKEEIQNTWLSQEDLYKIRQSCRKVAIRFSKEQPPNSNDDDENYCLRGLEGRTKQGVAKRKKIKLTARNAVLREQRIQYLEGSTDDERLADKYFQQTEYSQVEAHMVGLRDQAEVKALHENDIDCEQMGETITLVPTSLVRSQSKARSNPAAFRKSSSFLARFPVRSDSTRSLQCLTPTRRLLTDAFFRV